MERFFSRKLWMTILVCVSLAFLAANGQLPLQEAVQKITLLVIVYLGSQGLADIGRR